MLIPLGQGMVNLILEPRFQGIGSAPLVSVKASDFNTFELLGAYPHGTFLLDYRDSMFPFSCFMYPEELGEALGKTVDVSQITQLKSDVTREPKCWKWVRWVDAENKGTLLGCDCYVGFSLVDEIAEDRYLYSTENDRFYVYPMWEWPKNMSSIDFYVSDESDSED